MFSTDRLSVNMSPVATTTGTGIPPEIVVAAVWVPYILFPYGGWYPTKKEEGHG